MRKRAYLARTIRKEKAGRKSIAAAIFLLGIACGVIGSGSEATAQCMPCPANSKYAGCQKNGNTYITQCECVTGYTTTGGIGSVCVPIAPSNPSGADRNPPSYVAPNASTKIDVVRAFYAALSAADGVRASSLVIPSKRATGPFSAAEISRFYGSLAERLTLTDVQPSGPSEFEVRYTFRTRSGRCDGHAIVTVTTDWGSPLIERIKSLSRC